MENHQLQRYLSMANEHVKQKQFQEALNIYNAIVEQVPDCSEAHFQRGVLFNMKGDLGKAMRCYQAVLELDSEHADAAISLSILLNDIGRYEEAKNVFTKVNDRVKQADSGVEDPHINRKFSMKHYELAEMYASYNRYDEALFEYNKAVGLNPQNYEIRLKIAKLYAKKGFKAKAFEELMQLKNESPDYLPAKMALGLLHFESSNVFEARTEWQTVLQKDPMHQEARMYLQLSEAATETTVPGFS
ncbi:MAG: tetratricopeptide repeat protein [Bacteriovoracia bacterium]